MTKIYLIPEGFSLDFERHGIQEVPLDVADFTVVLLEKSETLDTPEVQEQIKQALSAGKVLGLPIGSCDSQTITKARSLGLTMIVPKARSKYDIMNAIKNFF